MLRTQHARTDGSKEKENQKIWFEKRVKSKC
jgi:hypothetical protein